MTLSGKSHAWDEKVPTVHTTYLDLEPVKDFKQDQRWPVSVYYDVLKPVLWVLRIIGRAPYFVNKQGEVRAASFFSWLTLYSVLTFIALSYVAIQIVEDIFNELQMTGYKLDSILFSFIALLFINFHFHTPCSMLSETKQLCAYINKWKAFQTKFENIIDSPIVCQGTMRKLMITVEILKIPSVILITTLESSILHTKSICQIILYGVMFWSCVSYMSLWSFTSCHTSHVAETFRTQVSHVLTAPKIPNRAQKLARLRDVWMDLSNLTQEMLNVTRISTSIMSQICVITFIVSCYSIIISLMHGEFTIKCFGFMFFGPFMCFAFFMTCNNAHRGTIAVGAEVAKEILKTDMTTIDTLTWQEATTFIQTIQLNPPKVTLYGFITFKRPTFFSFISATVTYLIVIVQFRSVESNNINPTGIPLG